MAVQNGIYRIGRNDNASLTPQIDEENSFVVLIEPILINQWILTKSSDGNYTIKNTGGGGYFLAPVDAVVQVNTHLVSKREPFEWRIQPAGLPNHYHIVVPGGPIDGCELAADLALERIYPPRTALRPLDVEDSAQAWLLRKLED
ncbi:hypothetical protein BDQ17DRAFT_1329553 [Cyathus striatus]|nr:hypothetical protein BDQ17DRAFT_1329553 [Cyathus striatus]